MSTAAKKAAGRGDPAPTLDEITTWLALLSGDSGHAIEVRAPEKSERGWHQSIVSRFGPGEFRAAARRVLELSGQAPAVYVALNGVSPGLPLGPDVRVGAKAADIPRRIRLLVDFDPRRPKDTNATDAEKAAAHAVAMATRAELADRDWPEPIVADSGNGSHLLYRLDLPADDTFEVVIGEDGKAKTKTIHGPSTLLIRRVLGALARRFDTSEVEVDCRVFDQPRLVKCYGSLASKGEDAPGRPARYSRVLSAPDEFIPVTAEQLEAIAAEAPDESGVFNLEAEIERKRGRGDTGEAAGPEEPKAATATGPRKVDPGRKAILDQFSDDDLLTWARRAKNGAKFTALYDAADHSGYQSASEADCALLVLLAYWTGDDAARMERLFDGSALAKRGKWADRPDYRDRSIAAAIERNAGNAPDLTEMVIDDDPDAEGMVIKMRPKPPPEQNRWGGTGKADGKASGETGANGQANADSNGQSRPTGNAGPTVDEYLAKRPLTDLGNAERLVARHGRNLRYFHPGKAWRVWDGKRWKVDDTAAVRRMAKDAVRKILDEAKTIADDEQRKAHTTWAFKSEDCRRLDALLKLAAAEPKIPVLPGEMDGNPWLFNCENGTVDLRTGELRAHRREDLITKIAPVTFDPDARCPRWEQFEKEIFGDDMDLVGYMRRVIGYAMTGLDTVQEININYGDGSNGKNAYLDTLREIFGDYGDTAEPDLLLESKNGRHPTGVADLQGKRLICASEIDDGKELAEALVKRLTGDRTIKARFMHQDFFEFKREFKVFLNTNYKPDIKGTDTAIWRRIRLIPFSVKFETDPDKPVDPPKVLRADPGLPDILRREAPGILALLVRACLEWQRDGMNPPKAVTAATEEFRKELDVVADFIELRCTSFLDHSLLKDQAKVKAGALYRAYVQFANDLGIEEDKVLSSRRFGSQISRLGYRLDKSNSQCWRLGIQLKEGKGKQDKGKQGKEADEDDEDDDEVPF